MWYHYFPSQTEKKKHNKSRKENQKESPKRILSHLIIKICLCSVPYAEAVYRPNHSDVLPLSSLRVCSSGLFLCGPLAILLSPS